MAHPTPDETHPEEQVEVLRQVAAHFKMKCPCCPMCDGLPVMLFGTQAFCGNDHCLALVWRTDKSLDENLLSAREIQIPANE